MTEQLFDASWRGVPFFVEDDSETFGHHTVIHEFPGRKPRIDQPGPMPERFRLSCILVGPNYKSDEQRLRAELRTPGVGRLVHHRLGSFLCKAENDITITWNTRKMGSVTIAVTFIVADEEDVQSVSVETFDMVITEGEIARAAMIDMVADDFDATINNGAQARATTMLEDVQALVASANGTIQSQFASVNSTGSQITAFGNNIEALIRSPSTMATTVAGLIDATFAAITGVVDSVGDIDPLGDGSKVLSALLRGRQLLAAMGLFRDGQTYGDDYPTITETTSIRAQRALNQRRMIQLVRISFLIGASQTVARVGIGSSTDAATVFTQINTAVRALRGEVDDSTYRALMNLRAAVGAHLRQQAARLPAVVSYTPVTTLPALLLAHRLYGDYTREAEICERNRVDHPGFVHGNVAIEVLSA